ncbi:hypothetical protein N7495_009612 [Penicillium taxi]|uniref:uncharacterized protein n=1 Tax=Penicillium taxi TaxID=168475 RepID=UPI002545036D|nr:uncharacterized protein N7495_009612 [Penicillium taxi]KAJ5885102.1 hypothetical protein N7495_009612 [Penicillium taxi]
MMNTVLDIPSTDSTYYADLDASRITPMAYFYWSGREKISAEINAKLSIKAAADFKKEIKPFERYEMRSQVVAWDHQWIYLLTHFVKTGKRNKNRKSMVAAVAMSNGGKVPPKPPVTVAEVKNHEGSVGAELEFTPSTKAGGEWTWEQIEAQRLRELEYCRSFMGIDDDF